MKKDEENEKQKADLLEKSTEAILLKKRVPFVIKLTCVLISLIAIVYISILVKSLLVPLLIPNLLIQQTQKNAA